MTTTTLYGRWPSWIHGCLIIGPLFFATGYSWGACDGCLSWLKAINALAFGLWTITLAAAWLFYKHMERLGERELLTLPKEQGNTAAQREVWNARSNAANEKLQVGRTGILAVQRMTYALAIAFGVLQIVLYLFDPG